MATLDFRLNVTQSTPVNLDAPFRKRINEIFNKHALDAADKLQQNSPVGATGDLSKGWDIIPARRQSSSFDVSVNVINNVPNALNRIVGRAPGKFPPEAPILAWVQKKLKPEPKRAKGIAFVIRRKIAREGTQRWKAKQNFAGLDLKGKPLPGSPIAKAEAKIAAELNQLKLE